MECEDLLVCMVGIYVCINLIAVLFLVFGMFPHKVK